MTPAPDDARRDDPRSDELLVAAVERGDLDAFEALYNRYRGWVVRLARRFTGHDDDALDVLQETFAYFVGKFPGFELRARLTTFLYPVVKHLSLDARRRARRFAGDVDAAGSLVAPQEHAESGKREELAQVLAALPEGHREALLMRFVDDMSLDEIGAALGIPTGTVKSRIHHALARLRQDPGTRRYFDR